MLTNDAAQNFARAWTQAWNDKDVDALASLYSDEIVFHSPRMEAVTGSQTPWLAGKTALRNYWSLALDDAPDIFFEIEDILISSDALTLLYINHRGQKVAETFIFGEGNLVRESVTAYG